jgi:hypothetical protein
MKAVVKAASRQAPAEETVRGFSADFQERWQRHGGVSRSRTYGSRDWIG